MQIRITQLEQKIPILEPVIETNLTNIAEPIKFICDLTKLLTSIKVDSQILILSTAREIKVSFN